MQALSQDNRELLENRYDAGRSIEQIPCCPVTMPACNAVDEPGTG
jgi:hypothetical protein